MSNNDNTPPKGPRTTLINGPLSDELSELVRRLEAETKKTVLLLVAESSIDMSTYEIMASAKPVFSGRQVAIVVHSPGGLGQEAYKIARLLQRSCGGFTAIVPTYAKSAATLLCLGAREIVMGPEAELGPLDVQIRDLSKERMGSALDDVQALARLNAAALEAVDQTMMMLARRTRKKIDVLLPQVLRYVADMMRPLLEGVDTIEYSKRSRVLKVAEEYAVRLLKAAGRPEPDAQRIASHLVEAYPEHGFVIDREEAQRIGLPVGAVSPQVTAVLEELRACLDTITAIGPTFEPPEDVNEEHGQQEASAPQ